MEKKQSLQYCVKGLNILAVPQPLLGDPFTCFDIDEENGTSLFALSPLSFPDLALVTPHAFSSLLSFSLYV
jgi:hypothetical protein